MSEPITESDMTEELKEAFDKAEYQAHELMGQFLRELFEARKEMGQHIKEAYFSNGQKSH